MSAETLTPHATEAPPAEAPRRVRPAYDGPVTWADVCADPLLQDLPFKIELDRFGRILMSPPFAGHARRQYRIARLLEDALGGVPATECPVATADGVKVPDVVWMSDAFAREHRDADVYPTAPELCVEVPSKSNPWEEMDEKAQLYLAQGAHEVWICEVNGTMRFFGPDGERERSRLAPDFPAQVDL